MAELFIDPGQAFKSGYEAMTTVGEDISATSSLKKAYEATPTDEAGKKDMFKVNSLAAQMAASQGRTRSAEKFEKQAEASKKSALENQLNEMKTQDEKFNQLEKKLQLINTAEDGIKATLDSDMPEDTKMRVISMFKEAGNDPKKLSELKDKFQNAAMDAKDRLSAAQKVLKMQLDAELKREGLDLRRDMLSFQAGNQQALLDERKDWHEYQKQKDKEDRALKQERADNDLLTNYDKLEIAAGKIKDPETRKKALAKLKERRQAAEDRIAGRGDATEEGQPDKLGRYKAKPGQPPTVKTQEDYDKLKSGDIYIEDGKKYRKP